MENHFKNLFREFYYIPTKIFRLNDDESETIDGFIQ